MALLSQQYGFGSVLIMLSSEAFDVECRRFRELWSWAVAPSSLLFPFQERLLALAGHLHSIGMDKMETALLCALSLFSTGELPLLRFSSCVSLYLCLPTYLSRSASVSVFTDTGHFLHVAGEAGPSRS